MKPAYQTVFWNGVMVHLHKELMGPMVYRQVANYTPHDAELPISLQDHHNPGAIPQHLGAPPGGLRSAGEIGARFDRRCRLPFVHLESLDPYGPS